MNVSVLITLLFFCVYATSMMKNKGELISSLARHFQVKSVSLLYSAGQDYEDSLLLFKLERYLSHQYIFSQSGCWIKAKARHDILQVILHETQAPRFLNKNVQNSGFWLLFLHTDIPLDEFFTDIDIPLDCEFLVAQSKDGRIILTEVYRINPRFPLQKIVFGNWSPTTDLVFPRIRFYERRKNLQGVNLVGAVKEGPATIVVQRMGDEIVQIGGFIGKLWSILMNMGNFTTKYVGAADNAFGVNMNGTWTGMLGMLQRNEIDAISTDILMDKQRLDFVDFMIPLFEVRTYMYTRNPENLESDWKSFLKPFDRILWLVIIAIIFLLAISLHVSVTTEQCITPRSQCSALQLKVHDCLFSILSSFYQQGIAYIQMELGMSEIRRSRWSLPIQTTGYLGEYVITVLAEINSVHSHTFADNEKYDVNNTLNKPQVDNVNQTNGAAGHKILIGQVWWLHLPESSRILVITSYLTALILSVGYSGYLVSYLAFRTNQLPFRTFRQFLQDGTYQLGVLSNSVHYTYFKESTEVVMMQVFNTYIFHNKNSHPESFLEGLRRICTYRRYNFMAPVFIVSSLVQQLECRILEVPEAFIPATATMALARNSPYRHLFSHYSKRVQRSGVLKKLRISYIAEKLEAVPTELQAADFESLEPLFYFLGLGIVLATLVLILEIIVFKKIAHSHKNTTLKNYL